MSVYSGFATRILESQYNGLVCKLLSLCEQRLLSFLRTSASQPLLFDNEQWSVSFCSVFKAMKKLEGQKYLPPKYTHYCKELAECLGVWVSSRQHPGMSRDTSMNSSRMSANVSREWDANLHQYPPPRLEAMLIEESRILAKPPRFLDPPKRSGSFVKRNLRFEKLVPDPGRQHSRATYSSRGTRKSQAIALSPRTQDTGESSGYPRSVDISRLDEVSDIPRIIERRRRRPRRDKLSEVYQDRAFSKLLSELRT